MGSIRDNNEDFVLVCNEAVGPLDNLYIVSDGMGGHNAGEIASKKAIEYFVEYIKSHNETHAIMFGEDQEAGSWLVVLMQMAATYANQNVYAISRQDASLDGMGATFTALSIKHGRAYVVHMGDSRAYLVAGEKITQLTTDHTYVNDLLRAEIISDEQARTHHLRNVITRAMGSEELCEVDRLSVSVEDGDIFVLCSDGLTNMIGDDEIYKIVSEAISSDLEGGTLDKAVASLVEAANNNGGDDNISVILIGGGL